MGHSLFPDVWMGEAIRAPRTTAQLFADCLDTAGPKLACDKVKLIGAKRP